jgi:Arm DNA-binding domain
MALTDFAIRKAKPRTKPFKLTDGAGLHLLARANWCQAVAACVSIWWKTVTLAAARSARDAARSLLRTGVDPSVKRKLTSNRRRSPSSGRR